MKKNDNRKTKKCQYVICEFVYLYVQTKTYYFLNETLKQEILFTPLYLRTVQLAGSYISVPIELYNSK